MRSRLAAISCAFVIAVPFASTAQPQSELVGAWFGKLDNWTYDYERRDLVVNPDGSCQWDLPKASGLGKAKSCKVDISTGTVELITGADSTVRLKLRGPNLEGSLQLKNGGVFTVNLSRGEPPITSPQTAKMQRCDQSITYNTREPSAEVPANVRAFSGAWVGLWDAGICSVLIVEDVQANGMAKIRYYFGAFAQYDMKAGNYRYSGQIIDNTLKTGNGRGVLIEYVMMNPAQLSGTFRMGGAIGPSNGNFTRVKDMAP